MASDNMVYGCLLGLKLIRCTSPSGEKLSAETAEVTIVSDVPESKLGSPGGPLASKTFNFVTLHSEINDTLSSSNSYIFHYPKGKTQTSRTVKTIQ